MEVAVGWGASVGTAEASAVGEASADEVGGDVEVGWETSVGTFVGSPVGVGKGVLTALQAASRSAARGINKNFVLNMDMIS